MSVYKLFLLILLFVTGTVFILGSGSTPSPPVQARAPTPKPAPQVKWAPPADLAVVDYKKASEIPREAAILFLNSVAEKYSNSQYRCKLSNDTVNFQRNGGKDQINVPYEDEDNYYLVSFGVPDKVQLEIWKRSPSRYYLCELININKNYTDMNMVINNSVTALHSLGISEARAYHLKYLKTQPIKR